MRRIRTAVALLIALVVLLAGCSLHLTVNGDAVRAAPGPLVDPPIVDGQTVVISPDTATVVTVADGWDIVVPPGAVSAGTTLTVAPVEGEYVDPVFARAAVSLSSGQPLQALTFRYILPEPLPAASEVYLLSTPGDELPHEPVPGTVLMAGVSDDRRVLTAEVEHLSVWEWAMVDANHVLTSMAGLRTSAPICEAQPRPDWLEDVIYLEGRDVPQLVCSGADPNDASIGVVKIRNNRGVALIVTAPVVPAWAHQDIFADQPTDNLRDLLTRLNETLNVPRDEQSRTWVLPPGSGVDIGFTRESLARQPFAKITTTISTSAVAYGYFWQLLDMYISDRFALTGVQLGLMGVCFADAGSGAITAGDGVQLTAALGAGGRCFIEKAPDVLNAIARQVSPSTWSRLKQLNVPRDIAKYAKRATVALAMGQGAVVIADTLSTLALSAGAYEIGLSSKISQPAEFPATACGATIRDRSLVEHPHLGEVTVGLGYGDDDGPQTGCIVAVDRQGEVIFRESVDVYGDNLKFAEPATDTTDNVFITYNPGRYNGVVTLVPNESGYEEIGWGRESTRYRSTTHAYYYAELVGPGSDSRYQIKQLSNDCQPDCAGGTVTSEVLSWDGRRYTP